MEIFAAALNLMVEKLNMQRCFVCLLWFFFLIQNISRDLKAPFRIRHKLWLKLMAAY